MPYSVNWSAPAIDDVRALFEYLAKNSSLWDAEYVIERVLSSTDRLIEYPRLYEADPRFGSGIRRISVVGQNVLYEIDDKTHTINILSVVGQRQHP